MGERNSERSHAGGTPPSASGVASQVTPGPPAGDRLRDPASLGDPASRRRFLRLVGGAGSAAAFSTILAACGGEEQQESGDSGDPVQPTTDLEIANYALYLEYLEEDFYRQVVDSGRLRSEHQALARGIRQNEAEHVDALEAVVQQLAGTPVPRPEPRFDAVIAAGEQRILETAATVENLGAAAYLGQVTNLENTAVVETVLTIHSVEARHAAALNEVAGNGFRGGGPLTGSIPDGALAEPMTREAVLEAAARFVRA